MRQPRTTFGFRFGSSTKIPVVVLNKPRGPVAQVIHGLMEGLAPLVILIVIVAFLSEVSTLGRTIASHSGIDALQNTELLIGAGGIVLALIIYIVILIRTSRNVRDCQMTGEHLEAMVALICLAFTAIVTLIPLFIALTAPQHPAL